MHHSGTFTIDTPRLLLRRFEPQDLEAMHRNWASLPSVQVEYGEPVYKTLTEAKELLEKYDVRECVVSDGVVRWRIPYLYIPALSVDYVYSPNRPFPKGDWPGADRCRSLGNNWYWWRIR